MPRSEWGPNVQNAVEELGIRLDRRGLLPLEEARRRVQATTLATRGESHAIPGQAFMPTDFDYLWASLLSLEDVDEFVREACRIKWMMQPRGFDNTAPVERYGAGVTPWLAHLLRKDGSLPPAPWCVKPCLLALDTPEALELLFRVARARRDGNLLPAWLRRHGEEGAAALTTLAARGHREALALHASGGGISWLPDLDDCLENGVFPTWENAKVHPGAMRVSGFKTPRGGALIFESMAWWPAATSAFIRNTYAFGPGFDADRARWGFLGSDDDAYVTEDELRRDLDGHSFVDLVSGAAIVGDGKISLEVVPVLGPFETYSLEVCEEQYTVPVRLPPLRGVESLTADEARRISPVRALLYQLADRVPRDDLFADSEDLAEEVGLEDAELLFRFDDWRHPSLFEKASDSPDLRAMTEALLRGGPLTGLPSKGKGNNDWRYFVRDAIADEEPLEEWRGIDPREGAGAPPKRALDAGTEWALARGFPHVRQVLYSGDGPDTPPRIAAAVKKHLSSRQLLLGFSHRVAWALVRTLGARGDAKQALIAASKRDAPILPVEARGLLSTLLDHDAPLASRLVGEFVLLLEALLGGETTIALVVDALVAEKRHGERTADVVRALGHVLRRHSKPDGAQRKRLEALRRKVSHELPPGRALDVILNGSIGVKRSATRDGDLAFSTDAKFVAARSRSAEWPLVPDPQLWLTGGDAVIGGWLARMDRLAVPGWQVVFECGSLRSKRLAELLLSLPGDEVTQGWVEHRFKAWPDFLRPQLSALARSGARAKEAKAMLRKLKQRGT